MISPGSTFSPYCLPVRSASIAVVADLRLLMEVGYRVAQDNEWPEWKPGTEFKAKREAMLATPRS
jgi:hypothetical protein